MFLAVGVITGLGLDWVSGGLLSTPGKVRLAITPSTAIGYSGASLLHALGIGVASKALESAVGAVALALTGRARRSCCAVRVRYENLVWSLGLLLLVSVVGGPAAWPWYLSWGIALLAACRAPQRWRWLPVVIVATSFLVRADGQLVLPRADGSDRARRVRGGGADRLARGGAGAPIAASAAVARAAPARAAALTSGG